MDGDFTINNDKYPRLYHLESQKGVKVPCDGVWIWEWGGSRVREGGVK